MGALKNQMIRNASAVPQNITPAHDPYDVDRLVSAARSVVSWHNALDGDMGAVYGQEAVRKLETALEAFGHGETHRDDVAFITSVVQAEYRRQGDFGLTPSPEDYRIAIEEWLKNGLMPGVMKNGLMPGVDNRVVNGHILLTPATCDRFHSLFRTCPVCEGGLQVCSDCGAYEAGLDEVCPGTPRPLDGDTVENHEPS